MLIISAFDSYQYRGIIWYMIKGKIVIVAIFMVWMSIGFYWLRLMFEDILKATSNKKTKADKYEKVYPSAKMAEEEKLKERKIGEAVDID